MAGSAGNSNYGGRGYEYGGPPSSARSWPGSGIGILTDDFWGWLFVGVGAGFILMGLIAALARK